VGSRKLVQPYVDAVCREIRQQTMSFGRAELTSIYVGGGTPSMLSAGQVAQILDTAAWAFGLRPGPEITLEANPDTLDGAKLQGFRAAGVTRISLGVQSFDHAELSVLGRGHSPRTVVEVARQARSAGFDNLGLDLIYGVPGQTARSWKETLGRAMDVGAEHLSMYSLIVEPGTEYARRHKKGSLPLPEDDLIADMYHLACEVMREHGYCHYEVANWARPGRECRHNLGYWRNEQFFAAGVGAHDYFRPYRSVRIRGVRPYVEAAARGGEVIERREHVGPALERFETVVMGLRLLREGLSRDAYRRRFEERLDSRYGAQIGELVALGLLEDDGESIRLPESMVPLANEAWERFLPVEGRAVPARRS
jgi:oxygen-independent coproporphyrinogen-3 oxidase